jgi:hypothetical protein
MWIVDVDIWRFRAIGAGHQATDNARSFPQSSDPQERIFATLAANAARGPNSDSGAQGQLDYVVHGVHM